MNKGELIIFSKPPVPGKVKTRLIPGIGRNKAASIYKELLAKTLSTAVQTDFSSIQLWVDNDINHPFFKKIKNRHPVKLYRQSGKDLGQRMSRAFDMALRKYPFVVLIGSDCPTLTVADLNQAGLSLAKGVDAVLGPAEDGGYYLIGLRENNFRLFENISWGKKTVMEETCCRINNLNWKFDLLSRRWDLDRTADLLPYFKLNKKEFRFL